MLRFIDGLWLRRDRGAVLTALALIVKQRRDLNEALPYLQQALPQHAAVLTRLAERTSTGSSLPKALVSERLIRRSELVLLEDDLQNLALLPYQVRMTWWEWLWIYWPLPTMIFIAALAKMLSVEVAYYAIPDLMREMDVPDRIDIVSLSQDNLNAILGTLIMVGIATAWTFGFVALRKATRNMWLTRMMARPWRPFATAEELWSNRPQGTDRHNGRTVDLIEARNYWSFFQLERQRVWRGSIVVVFVFTVSLVLAPFTFMIKIIEKLGGF